MTEESFAGKATDPQATPEAQESATNTVQPSDQEAVALVVGERAFRTMDDVRNKITNQDEFIEQLKAENAQLREFQESVKEVESVKDVLTSKETKGLTPEEVDALLESKLGAREQEAAQKANLSQSFQAAKDAYGDDFVSIVQKQAEELGLSGQQIDEMAGSNPKLFARTFLQKAEAKKPQSTFNSSVRTSNFQAEPEAPRVDLLNMTSKQRVAATIAALEQATKS